MVDTIASGETRDYFLGAGEVLHLYDAGNCRGTISRRNGASYEAICDLTPMTVGEPNGLAGPGGYRISLTAGSVIAMKSMPPAPGASDGVAFSAGAFDAGSRAGLIRATDPTLPLNRLKTILRNTTGKAPVAPASPATITISDPSDYGTGLTSQFGTSASDRVDCLFATTGDFSVHNKLDWSVYFTSATGESQETTYGTGVGRAYYRSPASGTDGITVGTIPFRFDGQKFELICRSNDVWTVFADGEPVTAAPIVVPAGAGQSTRRLCVDLGSRAARNIVCFGKTYGFAGISIGKTDSIAPIDLASLPKLSFITDSYGQGISSFGIIGPFGEAAARLITADSFPLLSSTPGGGSGFVAPGGGGHPFIDRLPNLLVGSPDLIGVGGGLNDLAYYATTLPAAAATFFAALRAAAPNAVVANVTCWTPTSANITGYRGVRDAIFAALQGVSGPWVDIDVTRGVWTNSAGASGRVGPSPWVTGTGKVGSTTGTGNADVYTSADGTHPPSPVGYDYLGGHFYTGLRAGILAL